MKKVSLIAAAALAALGFAASAASAATIYASSVISFTKATGTNAGVVNTSRDNAFNALGAPDSGVNGNPTRFYGLGVNKEIVLGFGQMFGAGPLKSVEVTFSPSGTNNQEGAQVYVALGAGPWSLVGFVSGRTGNNPQPDSLTILGGPFDRLKLVDATGLLVPLSEGGNGVRRYGSQGGDGYDLDSISVTAIPTPAALGGGMMLMGLLAAKRRRQA